MCSQQCLCGRVGTVDEGHTIIACVSVRLRRPSIKFEDAPRDVLRDLRRVCWCVGVRVDACVTDGSDGALGASARCEDRGIEVCA